MKWAFLIMNMISVGMFAGILTEDKRETNEQIEGEYNDVYNIFNLFLTGDYTLNYTSDAF